MHDHVQRKIIGALVRATNRSTVTLVRVVYDLPEDATPSRPQQQSVQRALRRLAKRGWIRESDLYGEHGTRTWVLDKIQARPDQSVKAKIRSKGLRLISP